MKITGYVATNRIGSKVTFEFEVDDADVEGMNDGEREVTLEDMAREAMYQNITWGWQVEA